MKSLTKVRRQDRIREDTYIRHLTPYHYSRICTTTALALGYDEIYKIYNLLVVSVTYEVITALYSFPEVR